MDIDEGRGENACSKEFLIEGRVTDVVMDDTIEPADDTTERVFTDGEHRSLFIVIDKGVTLAHDLPNEKIVTA